MKPVMLVAKHLYFGLDRCCATAPSACSRACRGRRHAPRVGLGALVQDLDLDTRLGRTVVDKMVADGMLEPVAPDATEYALTDPFRAIAHARIVARAAGALRGDRAEFQPLRAGAARRLQRLRDQPPSHQAPSVVADRARLGAGRRRRTSAHAGRTSCGSLTADVVFRAELAGC